MRKAAIAIVALLLLGPGVAHGQREGEAPELPLVPWAHPLPPPEQPPEARRPAGLWIILGGLSMTFGTLTTAALGACRDYISGWNDRCLGGVLGAGIGMIALGGTSLALGIVQDRRFQARKRQPQPPPRPRVVLAPAGAGVSLSGWF